MGKGVKPQVAGLTEPKGFVQPWLWNRLLIALIVVATGIIWIDLHDQ
jgi:hypothetical protein